jgi:activator of HSP90 ATPase
MANTIHHEISINASPAQVYEALTNFEKFSALTGAPAEIDPVSGGQFSCFGGMITGQTIEADPGNRLVQAWRVVNWESGVYSIVKFDFEKSGDNETKLSFDHTGFPEEHVDHLSQGWHDRYWSPLKAYLESLNQGQPN